MSKTILLVEDDHDSREMLRFFLESLGYRVVEAADGFKALESFSDEPPDLVLMDISLPGLDGLAATRRIKRSDRAEDVSVVCLTGFGQYFRDEAIEAGCQEVLAKPVDFNELIETIKKYLEK